MNIGTSCLDFQGDARAGLEVPHGVGMVGHHPPVRPQQLLRADLPEAQHLQAHHLIFRSNAIRMLFFLLRKKGGVPVCCLPQPVSLIGRAASIASEAELLILFSLQERAKRHHNIYTIYSMRVFQF